MVFCLMCDSSSPPVCDGPNISGLPTPGVVSLLCCCSWSCAAHMQDGLPMSDTELRTAESPQLFIRRVLFCCGDAHFLQHVKSKLQLRLLFQSFKVKNLHLLNAVVVSVFMPFHSTVNLVWGQLFLSFSFCITHTEKHTICSG